MPGVVCTTPPPPTACTMPSALTSHTTASTMSSDLTSNTSTGTHVVWRYEHSMPPWPDSESGIEDSPDSVDGGMMPLSPPIPIPSPRRSSLQPSRPCVSSPTEAEPQQRRTSASAPALSPACRTPAATLRHSPSRRSSPGRQRAAPAARRTAARPRNTSWTGLLPRLGSAGSSPRTLYPPTSGPSTVLSAPSAPNLCCLMTWSAI